MRIRYIGPKSHPGWKGALPHYRIECERHGILWDYPHGYAERVECPICAGTRWGLPKTVHAPREEAVLEAVHRPTVESVKRLRRELEATV
jgi:hypothetical protein